MLLIISKIIPPETVCLPFVAKQLAQVLPAFTAVKAVKNNSIIGWISQNTRSARAARSLVHVPDKTTWKKIKIFTSI